MGLQGPPYAVLSPLVTDPLAPPGDPESSLFLTCHFVRKGRRCGKRQNGQNRHGLLYIYEKRTKELRKIQPQDNLVPEMASIQFCG